MAESSQRFGKILKSSREKQGLTLSDVVAGSSMSVQYLCDVENGRRPLNDTLITHIARKLNQHPDTIGAYLMSEMKANMERRSGIKFDLVILPKAAVREMI